VFGFFGQPVALSVALNPRSLHGPSFGEQIAQFRRSPLGDAFGGHEPLPLEVRAVDVCFRARFAAEFHLFDVYM